MNNAKVARAQRIEILCQQYLILQMMVKAARFDPELWLLRKKSKHAQGLICMIDHIQDMAVNNGGCTELEVFGPPKDAPVEGAPT